MTDIVKHPEFARRMHEAADSNPKFPLLKYGRLTWLVEQLSYRGTKVTVETVRKWFAGETLPRKNAMKALSDVLDVPEYWLAYGTQLNLVAAQLPNAEAPGPVNFIAGIIQMSGGTIAFPKSKPKEFGGSLADLFAIIKGVQYSIHAVKADERGVFSISGDPDGVVILAVRALGDLQYEIFAIDYNVARSLGERKGRSLQVNLNSHPWRKVTSFSDGI